MRRFFTDKKLTVGTEIVLDGEETHHDGASNETGR